VRLLFYSAPFVCHCLNLTYRVKRILQFAALPWHQSYTCWIVSQNLLTIVIAVHVVLNYSLKYLVNIWAIEMCHFQSLVIIVQASVICSLVCDSLLAMCQNFIVRHITSSASSNLGHTQYWIFCPWKPVVRC